MKERLEKIRMNEFNEYVRDCFSAVGDIVIKSMMGGFLVYFNGKLIGDVCVDELFLKRTPTSDRLLADSELRYPYEESKTLMHVFDSFDEIKICTAYKDIRKGEIYNYYPTDVYMHKYLEPVYETHKGWKTDITKITKYEDLPQNTKNYLQRLEELRECPISIVSVGPDRTQTIFKTPI